MHSPAQNSTDQHAACRAYSTAEVGVLLGVSRMTVHRLITSGALPAFNVGSAARPRLRVMATALDTFRRDRQIGA